MQLRVVVSNCYDYIGYKQALVTKVELLWRKNSTTCHLPMTDGLHGGIPLSVDSSWDKAVLLQQEMLW